MKCPECGNEVKKDKYGLLEPSDNPFLPLGCSWKYHNCMIQKRIKYGYDKRHKGKDYFLLKKGKIIKTGTLEEAREWSKKLRS